MSSTLLASGEVGSGMQWGVLGSWNRGPECLREPVAGALPGGVDGQGNVKSPHSKCC